jgi:hypothetical protein
MVSQKLTLFFYIITKTFIYLIYIPFYTNYIRRYRMDKTKIVRKISNKKVIPICIRITPGLSKWIKDNKYSPTGIFQEACKDLGYKKEE